MLDKVEDCFIEENIDILLDEGLGYFDLIKIDALTIYYEFKFYPEIAN